MQPFGGKEQVASRLAKARAETAEADEQRKLSAGALNSSLKSQSESYAVAALTPVEAQDSRCPLYSSAAADAEATVAFRGSRCLHTQNHPTAPS